MKENFEANIGRENVYTKTHESRLGFQVAWFHKTENPLLGADIKRITGKPGIYIRLVRPDKRMKEEKYFEFGQEDLAEQQYQKFVALIDSWDQI